MKIQPGLKDQPFSEGLFVLIKAESPTFISGGMDIVFPLNPDIQMKRNMLQIESKMRSVFRIRFESNSQ